MIFPAHPVTHGSSSITLGWIACGNCGSLSIFQAEPLRSRIPNNTTKNGIIEAVSDHHRSHHVGADNRVGQDADTVTPDTYLDMGPVLPGTIIGDIMSSTNGPMCYIYE